MIKDIENQIETVNRNKDTKIKGISITIIIMILIITMIGILKNNYKEIICLKLEILIVRIIKIKVEIIPPQLITLFLLNFVLQFHLLFLYHFLHHFLSNFLI